MPEVPLWFTAEVTRRLRGVKRVPGSLQHYACCPVPSHNDRNASMGIKPGDSVMLVYNCQAGCPVTEIRAALVALGVPDEYLGILGTPEYEARHRIRVSSEERRQIERLQEEMAELKSSLRRLLSADLSLALLKVRILAVVEEVKVPAGRKEYVAFAVRAGVSQPRAYAAWKADPFTQGQDQCVSQDNVVLADPEENGQATQVSTPDGIIGARTSLSKREDPDSRNENYRNEKTETDTAIEALRSAGLTKPAA